MLKVGLTGGVACGKSTVGEMFVSFGAHLIKADEIAHQLMQPGETVFEEVVAAFGPDVLNADGRIDRPKLADKVFPTGRIKELNAIVHPAVIAAQEKWMDEVIARDPRAIAIVEAALLLEAGTWKRFDQLITVVCSPEQKIERFGARHAMTVEESRAEVERRQRAQAPDEDKVKIANFVVDNSGGLEQTRRQVEEIWVDLRRMSEERVLTG